jgi:hypothetical protein
MIFRTALLFSVSLMPAASWAQQQGMLHTVESNTFRPVHQSFTEDLLARLKVPEGFEVSVFARDLGKARMMAVAESGIVYVTRPEESGPPSRFIRSRRATSAGVGGSIA